MDDCVFCKIIDKKLPADIIYEDDFCIVFNDIEPQAPLHVLAITKHHYKNIAEVDSNEEIGRLIKSAIVASKNKPFIDEGFRVIINSGKNGGQSVEHLHVHVLAGRSLTWPPG